MSRRQDWAAVAAERSTLADLLEGLAYSEWTVHSLGPGWRVRDVAARRVWSARPFRASKRYPDVQFRATDTDLLLGEDTPVTGPTDPALLALTGRAAGLDELAG